MSRLPRATGKQVIAALARLGFEEIRIRAATITCAIQMAVQLSCPPTRAK